MSGTIKAGSGSEVKLAGSESKDKMYEPKHKKKLVRVLTVVAYVFSVSLAAITLSLFYIFIYNPDRPGVGRVATRHHIANYSTRLEDERAMYNRTWLAPEEPRALPIHVADTPDIMPDLVQLHPNLNEEPDNWEAQSINKAQRKKRSLKKTFFKSLQVT